MRVEAVPEWRLRPADEAAVADLLERGFGPHGAAFGGRSFYHQRHHLRLLGRDDAGRIVGHVAVTWRAVRLKDALVDVAGLAEVATHPDRRGEGIARTLVGRAVDEARDGPARFVLLFGDAGFYGDLGFEPWPANPITHVLMDGARTRGIRTGADASLMVLALRGEGWDGTAPLDLLGPKF